MIGEVDRGHGRALVDDGGDLQLAEPRPCGLLLLRIGWTALCGAEQLPQRGAPARAQRRNPDGASESAEIAVGQVQQRVGGCDADPSRSAGGSEDLVAGLDEAFGDDPHVEAGPVVGHQHRRQLWLLDP